MVAIDIMANMFCVLSDPQRMAEALFPISIFFTNKLKYYLHCKLYKTFQGMGNVPFESWVLFLGVSSIFFLSHHTYHTLGNN